MVVSRALEGRIFTGSVYMVAAGKAAWRMAHAALGVLGDVAGGVVATKYGHARGCFCCMMTCPMKAISPLSPKTVNSEKCRVMEERTI